MMEESGRQSPHSNHFAKSAETSGAWAWVRHLVDGVGGGAAVITEKPAAVSWASPQLALDAWLRSPSHKASRQACLPCAESKSAPVLPSTLNARLLPCAESPPIRRHTCLRVILHAGVRKQQPNHTTCPPVCVPLSLALPGPQATRPPVCLRRCATVRRAAPSVWASPLRRGQTTAWALTSPTCSAMAARDWRLACRCVCACGVCFVGVVV